MFCSILNIYVLDVYNVVFETRQQEALNSLISYYSVALLND